MRVEFYLNPFLPESGGQLNYVNITFRNEAAMLSLSFNLPATRTPKSLRLRVGENEEYELMMSDMAAAEGEENVFKTNILIKANESAEERYFSSELTLNDNSNLYHSTKTSELSNAGSRYSDKTGSFNNWIPLYNAEELKAVIILDQFNLDRVAELLAE